MGTGLRMAGGFFHADEVTGAVVQARLAKPVDLLLGRKTFDGCHYYLELRAGGEVKVD